jgi:hypothetical protein
LGAVLIGTELRRTAALDGGAERYRSHLITDVDRTLAASAAAGDLAAANLDWPPARRGGAEFLVLSDADTSSFQLDGK